MATSVRRLPPASGRTLTAGARRNVRRVMLTVLAVLLAALFVLPFLWTVTTSLKRASEIYAVPPTLFPAEPQWRNFSLLFTRVPFLRWIYNSLIITITNVIGITLSALLVSYSFSRFRWPGRDIVFMICLGTMMLPGEVTFIPTYILFAKLKWVDTWRPLMVPAWFGGGPFNIFLLRQFFLSLPRELDEAALIDGANPFTILWEILVPLCKPAITTVVVINFIAVWNDFFGPLIFLNSIEKYTISLGTQWFAGTIGNLTSFGEPTTQLVMAATLIATTPCVVLFAAAQRYFVEGIVTTGLKGAGV